MTSEGNPIVKIVTIGVYGSTEASFFAALREARIDTFCDIRWRRSVRGPDYCFVNSARLQGRLAALGIRYFHLRDLAPAPALRKRQTQTDKVEGCTQRLRTTLGEAIIRGYRKENLESFDSARFIERLGPNARNVALFCVEREPTACHRSLLAERLEEDLGIHITHLRPNRDVP